MSEPILVPLKKIQSNPYQPRTADDPAATAEIAVNIFRNGLLQVPSARSVNGHYELVFGHTRKAAYEMLATTGVPTAEIPADKRYAEMPLYIHDLDNKQMFEMAVAENIKRRDLNVIERATAMQRYMDEFNATSKQAGELFGGNDATVRGEVRFLDLPQEAQDKLAKGEMTQGTARTLLSVQRVTSSKTVVDILKKIEKTAGNEMPEETIEDQLERNNDVIRMWSGSWDEKPRGNHRDSWLLDMRNFPNYLLSAVTREDAIAVLNAADDKSLLKVIDAAFKSKDGHVGLLKESLVNRPELADKIDRLHTPPVCTACPFYTKVRGSHYCGNKVCHARKTQAWYASMIESASKALKIDIYKPGDGKYFVLDSYVHRSMFDKRDKALRLIPTSLAGSKYQYFSGVEKDVFIVCVVGDGIARLPKSSSGGSRTSENSNRIEYAEIKARQLYKAKRQVLIWEFTAIAKHVFDPCVWPMLNIMDDWRTLSSENEPPAEVAVADNAKADEKKANYIRRLLVWKIVEDRGNSGEVFELNKLVKVANRLAVHAASWGLKFPKDLMKLAVDGDAEVDALYKALKLKKALKQKAVAAATKKK